MKKLILLVLAFLLTVPLALSQSQMKLTMTSDRVKAKPWKDAALKKAIAELDAKSHSENWKWGAFSLLSGPAAVGYMINEAPNAWTILPKPVKRPGC